MLHLPEALVLYNLTLCWALEHAAQSLGWCEQKEEYADIFGLVHS